MGYYVPDDPATTSPWGLIPHGIIITIVVKLWELIPDKYVRTKDWSLKVIIVLSVLLVFSGLWVPLGSDLIDSIKFYIKESPEERSRRIGCHYFTKSLYVEEMYKNAMYVVEKGYDCKVPFCRKYCDLLSDKACSPDYKRRVTERMSDRLEYMGKLNHVLEYNCDCSEAVRDACSYKEWLKDDYTDYDY